MNTANPFRVKVIWDTDGEDVELPDTILFTEDVIAQIRTEVDEAEENDKRETFDEQIVKHLEATTGWLVETWTMLDD